MEKKWYQQTWAIIILLVFFFPAGLYLMWKYANWSAQIKWAVAGVFAVLMLIAVISSALSEGSDDGDSGKVVGDEGTPVEPSPTATEISEPDEVEATPTPPPEATDVPTPVEATDTPPPLVFQPASDFPVGSVEQTLANWVAAWRDQDWQKMVNLSQLTWVDGEADPAGILAASYDFKTLRSFEVTRIEVISEVMVDVTFVVAYEAFTDDVVRRAITARVIREVAPYEPSTQGQWGVNPISALRETDIE